MTQNRKVILIVQARTGSSRLPQKILMDICGKPFIQRVLERVRRSQLVNEFILAVPDAPNDAVLQEYAAKNDFLLYQGSEENVLDRFYQAIQRLPCVLREGDGIIRICADNPFVDSQEIDRLIQFFFAGSYDYAFNHIPRLDNQYPDGLGGEIFTFRTLQDIWQKAKDVSEREHVTQYLWNHRESYEIGVLAAPPEIAFPDVKLDVDVKEDFDWACLLYEQLIAKKGESIFSAKEIVETALSTKKEILL